MRPHNYAPRPAQLKWLLDSDPAIRWQVMRDLFDEAPSAIEAERSGVATEGWGANFSPAQSHSGNGGTPNEDRGLLVTLYSLVVLMDLGLDSASKQARKMIDRVDKHLVFKPLNNRPFLQGKRSPASTAESSLSQRISTNRITGWRINSYAGNSRMADGTARRLNLRQNVR
jgi:hypothetical protein